MKTLTIGKLEELQNLLFIWEKFGRDSNLWHEDHQLALSLDPSNSEHVKGKDRRGSMEESC
jgi:hypothetical protein